MSTICGIFLAVLVVVGGIGVTLWAAGAFSRPVMDIRTAGKPKRNYPIRSRGKQIQ